MRQIGIKRKNFDKTKNSVIAGKKKQNNLRKNLIVDYIYKFKTNYIFDSKRKTNFKIIYYNYHKKNHIFETVLSFKEII